MNTVEIIVTQHARERIKERMCIKSLGRMERIAMDAYENGFCLDELTGAMRNHLLKSDKPEEYPDRELRLYGDQVFIFVENYLVTVLPLNMKFRKNMEKKRSKQNKRVVA